MDNKPDQQIMGAICEGFQKPLRNTLGDMDEENWEVDAQGKPRDPWQFSIYMVMKEVGQPANTENLFTFATSSKGGTDAVGGVSTIYGKEMRTNPDQWPIVELGSSAYTHSNKEFGRIKTPILKVVGWEDKDQFAEEAPKAAAKKRATTK